MAPKRAVKKTAKIPAGKLSVIGSGTVAVDTERSALQGLLQHVAESEHHLRHPVAFKQLVEKAGFKLSNIGHKFEVQDAS